MISLFNESRETKDRVQRNEADRTMVEVWYRMVPPMCKDALHTQRFDLDRMKHAP